jgi:hypothetical protein
MMIFIKHLLRSIRKKPLQPIILVATLMLSVAISILVFSLDDALISEATEGQAARYGTADVTVGLSGNSLSRFMFADKAEELLEEWKKGDATEDTFGEMAKQHTEDSNALSGGLYAGVLKGQMVESFDNWCFDVVRKEGDYGIVRTKYGYHIMYFVDSEETWITQTRAKMMSQEAQKIVTAALDACPMEVTYKKIVLGEVSLA